MKKLLIPAVAAIVLGVVAGTAATYVNAKKEAKVLAALMADSLAKHAADSTAHADSVAKDEHAREVAAAADSIPLTPADSIRLAQHQPTTLASETHGVPDAADPKHDAKADAHGAKTSAPAADSHGSPAKAPANSHAPAAAPKNAAAGAKAGPANGAPAAHPPENKEAASGESAQPERRIAKIFGSMQSKDAAKVLAQMSDADVRVILNMMGEKQAAAILTALPANRAAAISKSELAKATPGKDEHKPDGGNQ